MSAFEFLMDKVRLMLSDEAHINVAERITTNVSYGASATSVYLGLTAEEWGVAGVITGIVLGFLTFGFNIWFKMKYQRPGKSDEHKSDTP